MADRISISRLRSAVDRLNDVFGYPREPYAAERDEHCSLVTNAGTYTLDAAYGGYRLCQMCAGGGERDLTGRDTARATYDQINAYIAGAAAMKAKLT